MASYLATYFLGLLIFTSCSGPGSTDGNTAVRAETGRHFSSEILEAAEKEFGGIRIINTGPRGDVHVNWYGESVNYRLFRIQVFNDTIVAVELEIAFPPEPVPLLPDSTVRLGVYLLPDSIAPDTVLDKYNFGITGLENFFESKPASRTVLNALIQPNEHQVLYIGMVFRSRVEKGLTRAKLFMDGQPIDNTFLPVYEAQPNESIGPSLDLIFGIAVDPPNHYTLLPCGKLLYK